MKKMTKIENWNGNNEESLIVVNHDDTTELLIEQWIAEADVQPLTQRSYRAAAKVFTGWLAENGELTEARLIEYREWLKEAKSTTTARLYFGLAKNFTGWLAKRGYIQRDVSYGVKAVKLDNDKHNRDSVSAEDIATALTTFSGDDEKTLRDRAIFALMAACGLRTIEVVRLNCGSIEKRRGNYTLRIWGKGRSGAVDIVNLPAECKRYIDEYLAVRGGRVGKGEPLFVSTSRSNRGQRLQTQVVSRMCKSVFRKIGLDSSRVTAHSLRHSAATLALEAGVDLDNVALNLRHKSTAVTQIYRHDTKVLTNPTNSIVAGIIFSALGSMTKGVMKNEG